MIENGVQVILIVILIAAGPPRERLGLARFGLFRCCQSRQKRFHGHGIRVREAPAPTDLLWENQDVPYWSRALRQALMPL